MGQLPASVIGLAEQLENATGVDLLKAFRPDEPEAQASITVAASAPDPGAQTAGG